ncbi:cellulase family glycosylhydrolase [Mucilaginibacter sp. JRF]|uniref:cellulase family glycosylhydrolase n=1 Tax=Mucilaginibacter sp. JRF TaxID=2780088 RepID=UPI001882A8FC|nr:cellulase family glycosylhydrolase [Mucilaginibacter sp. JRF]MBE9583307.1 cellulase family glycosylhydrolase [Mucilaginibacter sp. JRF]
MKLLLLTGFMLLFALPGFTQRNADGKRGNEIYIDGKGIIRHSVNDKEAAFFGVNYTLPFAYGYRSHKIQSINMEQAIDRDVYHLARLGVNAFRVHVWDTEISDSLGNLKQNEHLRLFDYLLARLEERGIRIIITPIAFWGNGYPERDERTGSFSDVYGKDGALVQEKAYVAQERYLKQFFSHVNSYTGKTYTKDAFIVATEVNNEPHHSGPKARTTEYVNRMAAAIKSTGWTKPVFYNISESPWYADAVAKSVADGFSFQWYPTGLVAGHQHRGNLLPHVDHYIIPFDTIPEFKNKARMVYEFDAGDVMQPYMYPAMARSFKKAGFQWATQFAYDPLGNAFANTEYQTHYLNLAYTPSKAISLLIAGRVFRSVPVFKSYGKFPTDTLFGTFRLSYKNQLSEMNSDTEFYYSNSTDTKPVKPSALAHIAGIGSSAVVKYNGTGAYFLDRLPDGSWRLEVMPDAVPVSDPFAKASLSKHVTRIFSNERQMTIKLPGLSKGISVTPINAGNSYIPKITAAAFSIKPGTYVVTASGKSYKSSNTLVNGNIKLNEFVAPPDDSLKVEVDHQAYCSVAGNIPYKIKAVVAGVSEGDSVQILANLLTGAYRVIHMQQTGSYIFEAMLPADLLRPGLLQYRIVVTQKGKRPVIFPGCQSGDPFAWDYINQKYYQTIISAPGSIVKLYNAERDVDNVIVYSPEWKTDSYEYVTNKDGNLAISLNHKPSNNELGGLELFVKDEILTNAANLGQFSFITVKAEGNMSAKIVLIDAEANAWSAAINIGNGIVKVPLSAFKPDSLVLLPRPYPGFQSLRFKSAAISDFSLLNVEQIQLLLTGDNAKAYNTIIEGISLETK